MIYKCNKLMYDKIGEEVTHQDLVRTNLTKHAFIVAYINNVFLCLPEGTITDIQFL